MSIATGTGADTVPRKPRRKLAKTCSRRRGRLKLARHAFAEARFAWALLAAKVAQLALDLAALVLLGLWKSVS